MPGKQDWKQLKLVVVEGNEKGEEYKLDRSAIGIGRSDVNQIVLTDSGVSLFHARITVEGTTCVITDLGAYEGVKVNGKKVDTKVLSPGDKIQVGNVLFKVARDVRGERLTPGKREPHRREKIGFRIPVRLSLLVMLLILVLAAVLILDLHWLNQLLNWQ